MPAVVQARVFHECEILPFYNDSRYDGIGYAGDIAPAQWCCSEAASAVAGADGCCCCCCDVSIGSCSD